MQISLEALGQAIAPIEQLGQGELTFKVGATPITLRIMTPEAEIDVQRFANETLDDDGNMAATADYLERFKLAVLSHAIVQVGDLDLRGVKTVETGEFLDDGTTPKKITKIRAVRETILKWSGSIRLAVFRKYGELVEEVERKAEKAVEFKPTDIDAEIERVKARLKELEDEKAKGLENPVETPVGRMSKAVAANDALEQAETSEKLSRIAAGQVEPEEVEPAPTPQKPPQTARQPVTPTQAAPPPPPKPQEPPSAPVAPQQAPEQPLPAPPPPQDSFVDSSDPDQMNAAVAEENRRLMAARMGTSAAQMPDSVLAAAAQVGIAKPPHLEAQKAMEELENTPTEDATAKPEPDPQPDQRPTFRLPVEEVGPHTGGQTAGEAPQVTLNDPNAGKGTRNPRFRTPQQ